MKLFTYILKPNNLIRRCYVTAKATSPTITSKVAASAPQAISMSNVTGLSSKCIGNQEPVGPGAAKDAEYKVPEYFNYNNMSYFEAEVEMAKYRCPQPSALPK